AVTGGKHLAGGAMNIWWGGNPKQMTGDYCRKEKLAMPNAAAPAVIGADSNDGNGSNPGVQMVLFQNEGKIFQVPSDQWKPVYDQFAGQCKTEHDERVARGGRD